MKLSSLIIEQLEIKKTQPVTDNVEKTTDEHVSCFKKDSRLENGEKTTDLAKIENILLQDEKRNSSRIQTSPPHPLFPQELLTLLRLETP